MVGPAEPASSTAVRSLIPTATTLQTTAAPCTTAKGGEKTWMHGLQISKVDGLSSIDLPAVYKSGGNTSKSHYRTRTYSSRELVHSITLFAIDLLIEFKNTVSSWRSSARLL
jgi:hypothetical protein